MPAIKQYPDRMFLKAVRELDNPSTTDVSKEVGINLSGCRSRLKELEEDGKIEHTDTGQALVWSRIEQENPLTDLFMKVSNN